MQLRWVAVLGCLVAATPARAEKPQPRPLPGFTGLVYRDLTLRDGCVKQTRVVRKLRTGDDAALVTLLTYPRLTGLDFSPDDSARRTASLRRFEAWFRGLVDQGRKVTERQLVFARDPGRTAAARVEAVARLIVVQEQMVALIQGIDVPATLRKSAYGAEAVDAFCDKMLEQAEPLAARVTELRGLCQKLIADEQVGTGWWTPVCARPAAPTPAPASPPPAVEPPVPAQLTP